MDKPSPPKFRSIIAQTRDHLWAELRRHKSAILAILLLSVILGVVPTFKSELESGLLQQINHILDSLKNKVPVDVWGEKVVRFDKPAENDWAERMAHRVFAGIALPR